MEKIYVEKLRKNVYIPEVESVLSKMLKVEEKKLTNAKPTFRDMYTKKKIQP